MGISMIHDDFEEICEMCHEMGRGDIILDFPFSSDTYHCNDQVPLPQVSFQYRCNAHRAAISRIKRAKYVRQYYLLHPDGSTVGIRATEPMDLIQMPFNMDTLTDEERRHLEMKRHKIKKFTKKQETVKFNADEYIDLWRKNSKKP
ncbi:unnamed protein product [Onchocerca ochengi]|uniref:Zf-C2H2_2 domain-containing protein n=1 Tax=Onchocerca ochengi TaxID=42157 RepID=A0A182E334_ONCOC|nr:unnamed protein product [Onchocerca ochengi]